ncbi:HK97 family phage prohead protease [Mediterraneibacter gnavus]
MNLYERVKRGDVDQCSFGFNILAGGNRLER